MIKDYLVMQYCAAKRWMVRYRTMSVCVITLCLITAHWYYVQVHQYRGLLQFVVLDVGQGTGVYIKTPSGKELLYDSGPTVASLREIERFRPFYDRSLDYLVASHADLDHIGMFPRILDSYRVEQLVFGPGDRDTALTQAIDHDGVMMRWSRGDRIVMDTDTFIEVLHPAQTETQTGNEESLVLILHHGDNSFLLTGDIDHSVELELSRQYERALEVDVLLVAHHGSRSSSHKKFITLADPQVAIVSAGRDNAYGHPHQEIIDKFAELRVPVLRTDMHGSIRVISDGESLLVQ